MNKIAVLMYHAIEDSGHPAGAKDAGEQCYVLQADQFREQMAYLQHEGFTIFLLNDLVNLEKWPNNAVILTFDDGHESNYVFAFPLLQQFGFKADFFITTDWIDTPHYMTAEQIKALHDADMGIGSHGLSHKFLDDMNDIEIEREFGESMEVLSRITGRKIVSFSAPGGRMQRGVDAIAKDIGYRFVCTSKPGILYPESSFLSIPRLAVRADTDLVTFKSMVHGDLAYVAKLSRRNRFLFFAKKIMGSKYYEKMREILMGMK